MHEQRRRQPVPADGGRRFAWQSAAVPREHLRPEPGHVRLAGVGRERTRLELGHDRRTVGGRVRDQRAWFRCGQAAEPGPDQREHEH